MFRFSSRSVRGFTLIELLVVIAIIAILAAILFPVFAKAREKARTTNCNSNFKNMAMGILQYSSDYDERMPPVQTSTAPFFVTYSPFSPGFDRTWTQLINPYVKNRDVWKCPSNATSNFGDTNDVNDQPSTDPIAIDFSRSIRSQGYNYAYLSPFDANAKWMGVAASAINNPAGMVMTVDSTWDLDSCRPSGGGNWFVQAPSVANSGTVYWFGPWVALSACNWLNYGGMWPHHMDATQVNVTFVDGHAKTMRLENMWQGLSGPPWGANRAITNTQLYIWDRD